MIQTSGIFTGGGEGGKYKPYLTFRSAYPFTLSVATPGWDGTLEYSVDTETWAAFDGSQVTAALASAGNDAGYYALYLRGTGNTVMTGTTSSLPTGFTLSGSSIQCLGNIETLLDYQTVEAGEHPTMGGACFAKLFDSCPIVSAPELPALTLTQNCYRVMFRASDLVAAPELPATTLAGQCYYGMFMACESLVYAPKLQKAELAEYCYQLMFQGCPSLISLPLLRSTDAQAGGVGYFRTMFRSCEKLKLSDVQTEEYTQPYRIPASGEGGFPAFDLASMFTGTGGTFADTPTTDTTYYVSNTNIVV